MKKKFNDKLALNRETLRTLTGYDLAGIAGGGTTSRTNTSNNTDTCETCVGPSCHGGGTTTLTTTGTSACC